jgi:hypothetical protein
VQVYKHFSWFRVKHFRQKQEESLKYKIKRDRRLKGAGHLRARQILELKDTLALNSSKYWGYCSLTAFKIPNHAFFQERFFFKQKKKKEKKTVRSPFCRAFIPVGDPFGKSHEIS